MDLNVLFLHDDFRDKQGRWTSQIGADLTGLPRPKGGNCDNQNLAPSTGEGL
jgi:hypothetical protein